jgi:seryl-tRNA synthetase
MTTEKKEDNKLAPLQVEKEKTISEKFMEELDTQEKEIFLKIKDIRMNTCEYEEFEAVTEDTLDDYVKLITYVKNDKVFFEEDGVVIKVRRPMLTDNKEVITGSIKLLFRRNEARERAFAKKIKIKPGDPSGSMDFARAMYAASLENIDFAGSPVILAPKNLSKMHDLDYKLLQTCYDFFRN